MPVLSTCFVIFNCILIFKWLCSSKQINKTFSCDCLFVYLVFCFTANSKHHLRNDRNPLLTIFATFVLCKTTLFSPLNIDGVRSELTPFYLENRKHSQVSVTQTVYKPDTDVSSAVLPSLSGENVAFGGKSSSWKKSTENNSKALPSASANTNLKCSVASLCMSVIIQGLKVKGRSCLRNVGCDDKGKAKLENVS